MVFLNLRIYEYNATQLTVLFQKYTVKLWNEKKDPKMWTIQVPKITVSNFSSRVVGEVPKLNK